MGRLVFVMLMLTLVANPDFRTRARPAAAWALSPVYGWMVQSRVDEIARALDTVGAADGDLPDTKALPGFLADYFARDGAGLDPWETPFFFSRDTWTVRVASAGPDRKPFTGDDVLSAPLRYAGR